MHAEEKAAICKLKAAGGSETGTCSCTGPLDCTQLDALAAYNLKDAGLAAGTGLPETCWDPDPETSGMSECDWRDETTGILCRAVRFPELRSWVGYVEIASSHPWYGTALSSKILDGLSVHGGANYFGTQWGSTWVGFDCAHGGDAIYTGKPTSLGTFRDLAYVRAECAKLAQQVANVLLNPAKKYKHLCNGAWLCLACGEQSPSPDSTCNASPKARGAAKLHFVLPPDETPKPRGKPKQAESKPKPKNGTCRGLIVNATVQDYTGIWKFTVAALDPVLGLATGAQFDVSLLPVDSDLDEWQTACAAVEIPPGTLMTTLQPKDFIGKVGDFFWSASQCTWKFGVPF